MHPTLRQRGSVILEVIVVLVVLAAIAAIVFPLLARSGTAGRDNQRYQAQCMNNVRQLTIAVAMYCQDHTGAYPDKATVWADVNLPPRSLSCPTYGTDKGNGYGYHGWLSNKTQKDPGMPPPYDLPLFADCARSDNLLSSNKDIDGRHGGKAFVGFADGHVALHDPASINIRPIGP